MALKEIRLEALVEALDEQESEYADFFRPMLGYEALITLHMGMDDSLEPLISEIEDETLYEFPGDLLAFYLCTNGGSFGDLDLFPVTNDPDEKYSIHTLNVIDKEPKTALGIDNKTLLIGQFRNTDVYVTCKLNDEGVYTYQLWDSQKKAVTMEFEYLIQIVALEMDYATDFDGQ